MKKILRRIATAFDYQISKIDNSQKLEKEVDLQKYHRN